MKSRDESEKGSGNTVSLNTGAEARPDECRDLLLTAVARFLKSIPENERSRRRTICEEILSRNELSDFESRLGAELESALKDGRNVPRRLERLGFKHERLTKHHQFRWGDQILTVSQTPSDCRFSKNEVASIKKQIFVGD